MYFCLARLDGWFRGRFNVFAGDRLAQAPETLYIKCPDKGVGGWENKGAEGVCRWTAGRVVIDVDWLRCSQE